MNMNLQLALNLAYNQLNTVAQSPEYWTILNSIFGTNYNSVLAQTLQQEWQAGNFSALPPVEILNSSILGKANGAYAASNNTIYLADTFVATATSAQLVAVLLEEIGHAVDAKINSSDTPGDEGELFSLLVRGITPSATELSRIQSENDQAIITLNGQPVAIEMAAAEPTLAWAKRFGVGSNAIITVDSSGNVYATGGFSAAAGRTVDFDPGPGTSNLTSAGDSDVLIAKLNSDGSFAWVKSFGGTGSDYGTSIKLDSSGNIYTTGIFKGTADFDPGTGTSNLTSAGDNDAFISKLNSDGSFAWAKRFGGTLGDGARSMSLDSSGNIYTTGFFQGTVDFDPGTGTSNLTSTGSAGSGNAFISKLNSDGSFAWAKRFGGTNNTDAASITVDSSGNIYTTGYFNGTADFDPGTGTYNLTSPGGNNVFVSKLNSDGSFAWAKTFVNSWGGASDYSYDIEVDSSGNVYTAGVLGGTVDFDPGPGTYNLTGGGFVSKLNSDGSFAWARQVAGSGGFNYCTDLKLDSSGNVYVTGKFMGTFDFDPGPGTYNLTSAGNSFDVFIYKLNSDGSFAWAKNYGSDQEEGGSSITVDSSGNIYTSGYFGAWGGSIDFGSGLMTSPDGSQYPYIVKLTAPITNSAPTITSAATATFAENGTGTVYTVTGTDPDAGTILTYSISGTDANLFNINSSNGAVTFKTAPNFELPSDNGTNNVYDINVIATDNGALTATQAVAITVTNVNDDVQSSSSYTLNSSQIDLALTGSANINGTGNSLNNVLFGNSGNNILDGGAGADTMTGGTGNDFYYVDNTGDSVIELANQGIDKVFSTINYTLTANVEDLGLQGTATNGTGNELNNTITGNELNNVLIGFAGDDTLMGGVGADTMTGGTGNDWYWVDNAGDSVIELANEGIDKVFTTISYTLTDNVEDLALQEIASSINGTGNSLNNTITDNSKDNVLDGGAGNDIIRASGGNDTLIGGLGTDNLTGGLGNDRFVYTNLTHSLLAGIDIIKDFNNSTDTDRFVVSTARSVFNSVGVVSGLNATAVGNALTTSNFGANAAALFTIGSKSYVAINDSAAGFNALSDAIVDITGYKGTLSTSSFVTV